MKKLAFTTVRLLALSLVMGITGYVVGYQKATKDMTDSTDINVGSCVRPLGYRGIEVVSAIKGNVVETASRRNKFTDYYVYSSKDLLIAVDCLKAEK